MTSKGLEFGGGTCARVRIGEKDGGCRAGEVAGGCGGEGARLVCKGQTNLMTCIVRASVRACLCAASTVIMDPSNARTLLVGGGRVFWPCACLALAKARSRCWRTRATSKGLFQHAKTPPKTPLPISSATPAGKPCLRRKLRVKSVMP